MRNAHPLSGAICCCPPQGIEHERPQRLSRCDLVLIPMSQTLGASKQREARSRRLRLKFLANTSSCPGTDPTTRTLRVPSDTPMDSGLVSSCLRLSTRQHRSRPRYSFGKRGTDKNSPVSLWHQHDSTSGPRRCSLIQQASKRDRRAEQARDGSSTTTLQMR